MLMYVVMVQCRHRLKPTDNQIYQNILIRCNIDIPSKRSSKRLEIYEAQLRVYLGRVRNSKQRPYDKPAQT